MSHSKGDQYEYAPLLSNYVQSLSLIAADRLPMNTKAPKTPTAAFRPLVLHPLHYQPSPRDNRLIHQSTLSKIDFDMRCLRSIFLSQDERHARCLRRKLRQSLQSEPSLGERGQVQISLPSGLWVEVQALSQLEEAAAAAAAAAMGPFLDPSVPG